MTLKQLKAAMKQLGCTVRYRDGEYRVNQKSGTEATAYYTDDREDALATAQAIVRHKTYESMLAGDRRDAELMASAFTYDIVRSAPGL